MTIYDYVMTTDQYTTESWEWYDHDTILTRPRTDNDMIISTMIIPWQWHKKHMIVLSWSCMVILWSFIGNYFIMLLSYHTCHIHLIVLSCPYHSHPISMVISILSWSSQGHGTGVIYSFHFHSIFVICSCHCHDIVFFHLYVTVMAIALSHHCYLICRVQPH